MRLPFQPLATILGTIGLAVLVQSNCAAQCAIGSAVKGTSWELQPDSEPTRLLPAGFQEGDESHKDSEMKATIVGFWHVIFTGKTMNGISIPDTEIDNALIVWHNDGTEIMNSARPPQDGNFCLGVWKQISRYTYKLNHFTWSGNQSAPGTPNGIVGDPVGPSRFIEDVAIDPDGSHYSGTFTLRAHDTSGRITAVFTGTMKATRITLNTTVPDLL